VWQVNGFIIGYYAAPCPLSSLSPVCRRRTGEREERGGAYVWRANPIHPWHKATGVSHMGQHTVVPPATPNPA